MIAPSDYTRIARAIAWLEENAQRHPPLADAARAAGLSTAHFQRLFTQWAGISPKRFLQARTADTALELLRGGRSVLDAAYTAGLSGPSRLHDLVLHAEAVTPGQLKSRGAGLTIMFGWHATPFGDALVAITPVGLCHLAFSSTGGRAAAEGDLRSRWPAGSFVRDDNAVAPVAARAFPDSVMKGGPLALHVRGTNFQLRVWKALLMVPPGVTTNYGAIAREIGKPSASRAVGTAIGDNPVSWLIPCHRVLRADGGIGGYAWGPERKKAMLVWEALQHRGKGAT
jgi:AraC family transcriptional regulator, regulatory protein of adaptative response / methylated-DNA-[protein]-cysteine methyltransferase